MKAERLIEILEKAGFYAFSHDGKTVKVANGREGKEPAGIYFEPPAGWVFGTNPKLDAIAAKYGLHAEWENPETIGLYK